MEDLFSSFRIFLPFKRFKDSFLRILEFSVTDSVETSLVVCLIYAGVSFPVKPAYVAFVCSKVT